MVITFEKGYVYKIIHNQSNICYIGSTFNIKIRWQGHKDSFKKFIDKTSTKNCIIYKYFEEFGINNFKMILIKEYEVCDRKHLQMYEQLWMNKLKCINKNKSFQPLNEERNRQYNEYMSTHRKMYYENNKERIIERVNNYYNNNKNAINEKRRNNYNDNKDKIQKQNKIYRDKNKEKLNEKGKKYYELNKEEINKRLNEKITCECGSIIKKKCKSNHLKSKKHLDFVN